MTLTDEEIRIKVAENLGAKRYERPFDKKVFLCVRPPYGTRAWEVTERPIYQIDNDVPNYLKSLDACAEFEATLTSLEFENYRWILWDLCKRPQVTEWHRAYLSSTPRQRCLAYLKTKGLIP